MKLFSTTKSQYDLLLTSGPTIRLEPVRISANLILTSPYTWVKAVNSQGSFGNWRYAIAYQREEIDDILEDNYLKIKEIAFQFLA